MTENHEGGEVDTSRTRTWHTLTGGESTELLKTDAHNGLSDSEVCVIWRVAMHPQARKGYY